MTVPRPVLIGLVVGLAVAVGVIGTLIATGGDGGDHGGTTTEETATVGDGNSTDTQLSPADSEEFVAVVNQMFASCFDGETAALTSQVSRVGDYASAYPDAVIEDYGGKTVRDQVTVMTKGLQMCFPAGAQELTSRLLGN